MSLSVCVEDALELGITRESGDDFVVKEVGRSCGFISLYHSITLHSRNPSTELRDGGNHAIDTSICFTNALLSSSQSPQSLVPWCLGSFLNGTALDDEFHKCG